MLDANAAFALSGIGSDSNGYTLDLQLVPAGSGRVRPGAVLVSAHAGAARGA